MADKQGFLTNEHRFGGDLLPSPPTKDYAPKDPLMGERKRKIEEIELERELKADEKEVWE